MAKCELETVPDFGILPDLVYLNVSFNPFDEITPQQFSPFCNLQKLDIQNSSHLNPCTCKSLHEYFDRRLIYLNHSFDCPTIHEGTHFFFLNSFYKILCHFFANNQNDAAFLPEEVYCSESVNATADTDDFDKCLTRVQEKKLHEKAKETWIGITIGLGVFFIIFIGKRLIYSRLILDKKNYFSIISLFQ